MTVYAIVQLKMTDRAVYDRYQARFSDVFKKFSGRLLSADENPAVLEGVWDRDKVVLMSFPDEAAFHAWANSPEYLQRRGPCPWPGLADQTYVWDGYGNRRTAFRRLAATLLTRA